MPKLANHPILFLKICGSVFGYFTIQCSSMITLCWFWRIWISICDDYVIINFSSYFTSSTLFFVIWNWIKIRTFILFHSMFWPQVIIFNYLHIIFNNAFTWFLFRIAFCYFLLAVLLYMVVRAISWVLRLSHFSFLIIFMFCKMDGLRTECWRSKIIL